MDRQALSRRVAAIVAAGRAGRWGRMTTDLMDAFDRAAITERQQARKPLIELVMSMQGDEDCRLDHNEYCQAHLDPAPCYMIAVFAEAELLGIPRD